MDVEALIEQLCVTAGMIMEDASAQVILRDGELAQRVTRIAEAAQDISALADAATRLALRLPQTGPDAA